MCKQDLINIREGEMLMKIFFPNEYVNSIYEIDYEELLKKGIAGLVFDIDNTLVPYFIETPSEEIMTLMKYLVEKGFKLTLVSNNNKKRVELFAEGLDKGLQVRAFHKSKKPRSVNLKKAAEHMKLEQCKVALIGDQVFTDVLGGNRTGLYTILVKPVSEKDELSTKFKRGVESLVIKQYLKYLENAK